MYASSYECPNCSAAVPFASAVSVFAVCGHCRSMVVRRDAQVDLMGLQAQLPPDLSPLQVGTQGDFDGQSFTLRGRIRVGYREGSWNEWCADFGGNRWGWVAEAQGLYQVSFELAPPEDLPGLAEWRRLEAQPEEGLTLTQARLNTGRTALPVGRVVRLSDGEYVVRDLKQTEVLSSEGELPLFAPAGRTAISADLGADGARFANLEYSESGIRLFLGRTCRFEELRFQNLRPLPGWTTTEIEPTRWQSDAINCPQCGAAVELRAPGLSMTCVCGNCGSLVDTSHPQVKLLEIARRRQSQKPLIPLGRRGILAGVDCECIGFLQRRDGQGYRWAEYLLFNPFAGFRWLVTYEGHWTLAETLIGEPRAGGSEAVFEGKPYQLFSSGSAEVTYVLGEFYWQVRVRERTEVTDYIAPPGVLSREKYPDLAEVTWSRGEYLPGQVVAEAFGLTGGLRPPNGIYLNQPNPHAGKGRTLRWLFPAFAVVFVMISLIGAATRETARVFDQSLVFVSGGSNAPIVTEPFELKGRHPQALTVRLDADVSNGWLETGLDLVQADTKVVRELAIGVEQYSGYDDGPWQEGSREREVLVPAVPPGRYYLVIETTGEPGPAEASYHLSITGDVMVWSNVWLGMVGLLAYPVFRWLREHAFERERWAASDFSPFTPVSDWLDRADDDD